MYQVSALGHPSLKRMGRCGGAIKGDREGVAAEVREELEVGSPGGPSEEGLKDSEVKGNEI